MDENVRRCNVDSVDSEVCSLLALIAFAASKASNENVTDGVSSEFTRGLCHDVRKPAEDCV